MVPPSNDTAKMLPTPASAIRLFLSSRLRRQITWKSVAGRGFPAASCNSFRILSDTGDLPPSPRSLGPPADSGEPFESRVFVVPSGMLSTWETRRPEDQRNNGAPPPPADAAEDDRSPPLGSALS